MVEPRALPLPEHIHLESNILFSCDFMGSHLATTDRYVTDRAAVCEGRYASIVGSYGWSSKAIEQIAALIPSLKAEILDPVLCRGYPRADTFTALDKLVSTIADRHATL